MSAADYVYVARLAPLGRDFVMHLERHGRTIETFPDRIFALQRKYPDRVPVWIEHDEDKVVGHLHRLETRNRWLTGWFRLDTSRSWHGVAEDMLEVGCPMSIAYSQTHAADLIGDGIKRILCGELHEVSIVPRGGAIEGAEIIHKLHVPELARAVPQLRAATAPQPAAKPVATAPAPPATAPPKPKPAPVLARRVGHAAVEHRALDDELRRRADWLETQGLDADLELINAHLTRETRGPSLDDLAAELRIDGTRVRRNVGQVLGVR